jgi:hypothetical protein
MHGQIGRRDTEVTRSLTSRATALALLLPCRRAAAAAAADCSFWRWSELVGGWERAGMARAISLESTKLVK